MVFKRFRQEKQIIRKKERYLERAKRHTNLELLAKKKGKEHKSCLSLEESHEAAFLHAGLRILRTTPEHKGTSTDDLLNTWVAQPEEHLIQCTKPELVFSSCNINSSKSASQSPRRIRALHLVAATLKKNNFMKFSSYQSNHRILLINYRTK